MVAYWLLTIGGFINDNKIHCKFNKRTSVGFGRVKFGFKKVNNKLENIENLIKIK